MDLALLDLTPGPRTRDTTGDTTVPPGAGCRFYLTFHGIGQPKRPVDAGEAEVWVSESSFVKILDLVTGHPQVGITFDDGNSSDHGLALPALLKRRLTASFFVLAGRLDQPGYLSRTEVVEMAAAGMPIGSHGLYHRPWDELSAAELTRETVDSRKILEDLLGREVVTVACPFGAYNRRVLRQLWAAGYQLAFTSDRGPAPARGCVLPRNTVHRRDEPRRLAMEWTTQPSAIVSLARRVRMWVKRLR